MGNVLPTKLPLYLVRLQIGYARKKSYLGEIIAHCHYTCIEDTAYDNWNGGMYGHDVVLFLPLDQIAKIDVDDQSEVASEIKDKLNKCAQGIDQEWFNTVRLELVDESDRDFQQASPFSLMPPVNPESLSFWKPGLARVFISHRDAHKIAARELSDALEEYGMACFVAHDTIKPMKTWRREILNGLQTMEIMIAYLTDDFQHSWYCHQEVGYALGRGIPIISLKLGQKDAPGFISEVQAVRGNIDRPVESARKLFGFIGEALRREGRFQDVLVNNFAAAPSYSDAKSRFDLMSSQVDRLTNLQIATLVEAFRSNDQLHYAGYLTSHYDRLRKFMDRTTGRHWKLDGKSLVDLDAVDEDDLPF